MVGIGRGPNNDADIRLVICGQQADRNHMAGVVQYDYGKLLMVALHGLAC